MRADEYDSISHHKSPKPRIPSVYLSKEHLQQLDRLIFPSTFSSGTIIGTCRVLLGLQMYREVELLIGVRWLYFLSWRREIGPYGHSQKIEHFDSNQWRRSYSFTPCEEMD
jgi:hypothetical protein